MARPARATNVSALPSQCWGTGVCDDPQSFCYVKYKTDHGGYAQCRRSCPSDWNCERRTPQGCGAATLPASLAPAPFSEANNLLAEFPGAALCDRRNPPAGADISRFEILCYDGGQTGNRYLMVKHMLRRAACCRGVALFPPNFDGLPGDGASCFDFRGLLPATAAAGRSDERNASCRSLDAPSRLWWSKLPKETPADCAVPERLLALAAAMHAGFAFTGRALGTACGGATGGSGGGGGGDGGGGGGDGGGDGGGGSATLVMHVRSGDIFTNWKDGQHTLKHEGFAFQVPATVAARACNRSSARLQPVAAQSCKPMCTSSTRWGRAASRPSPSTCAPWATRPRRYPGRTRALWSSLRPTRPTPYYLPHTAAYYLLWHSTRPTIRVHV